jgi:hypothetical protein
MLFRGTSFSTSFAPRGRKGKRSGTGPGEQDRPVKPDAAMCQVILTLVASTLMMVQWLAHGLLRATCCGTCGGLVAIPSVP